MAEKEERILIDVINPGINCVYRLDNDPKGQSLCKHNGNMEPVTAKECRHCDEGMTRQEAIEKMARAGWMATVCAKNGIIHFNVTKEQWDEEWDKLRKDYKKVYYAGAEAELDALLEADK